MASKILKYVVTMAIMIAIVACSGKPKVIPDETLKDIFHDAYIANAYLTEANINDDSLYIYEPIFEHYGYTIDDLHYTITTFTERKSAMLSDLMYDVNQRLAEESKLESRKMVVLDTIDNIATRAYTRTIYNDSLIRVKRMRDSSKLRIRINDIIPAEYTVSFSYLIDTLDENRNSRVEAYLINGDSQPCLRHTMMLSRYREGKYSRKFKTDTTHKALYINMFYHPSSEESKLPDVTINNFKVVRTLSTEESVDSLYHKQLNLRIFNHSLMTAFVADSVEVVDIVVERDSLATDSLRHDTQDSLTLRID